jgi:LmbE family N-acetylglucosaminyl deacetylase
MKVIAIGAHPDDIEFGCFGTLYRHMRNGDSIDEIILTNGELGGPLSVRKGEARKAAALIGAKVHFGGFPDGNLRDDHPTISYLESIIKKVGADIVYTTSRADRHQDHRYASLASASAARFVDEVYEYETPSVVNTFSPRLSVDIGDGMELKIKGLRCHQSQKAKRYLEADAVKGLARYRAYQAGLHNRMAEGFEVVRLVKRSEKRKRG